MKKIYLAAFALMGVLSATAQDTYESARLLGSDLNGTARYVGMGGAMEALGADISTISTNPAGIGVFRHSNFNVSLGFVSQAETHEFDGLSKTNMSFDQAGFVYASRLSDNSYINFAFNYHKSRNFDQILSAANSLKNCSQNGLTYHKASTIYSLEENRDGELIGWEGNERSWSFSESDYLNANALMLDPDDGQIYWMSADGYSFDRAHRGWIGNFDINLSGNVNDRVYWGITVGIKDVNYKGYSEYAESMVDASNAAIGSVAISDYRKIKGTGYDITGGVIIRPIEESPFRIGLSIATPTWYELTPSNDTHLLNNTPHGAYDEGHSNEAYDFKFFTPWKFGVSMGHTVSNILAIGLSYQYSDFGASKNRVNKEGHWYSSWYDDYSYTPSYTDEAMKENTERSLTGQHTLKAGVEIRPIPEFAVRLGYNYLSSPYEDKGVRDATLDSPGISYSSTTDYVNWKDTHRFTCGLGVKTGGFNIDLAYQYNATKGDFHPFQPYADASDTGVKNVDFKRHQMLLTLGYTF